MTPLSRDEIREAALAVGFDDAAPVDLAAAAPALRVHGERLLDWLAQGRHAGMSYLTERLDERLDPTQLFKTAKSAVVTWLDTRTPPLPPPEGLHGRTAAYATGRDYHNLSRKMLRKLRTRLVALRPALRAYGAVDTAPVLERALAECAGLGWIGRATQLVHPKRGTYGALAVLLIDHPVEGGAPGHPNRCGTCTACLDACPTQALDAKGLDARRCLSYWTIEHRGPIPSALHASLDQWVFGCDLCQEVCPFNRRAAWASAERWRPQPERAYPDLLEWIKTPNEALEPTLDGSPLQRATPAGLRRNALIALGNRPAAREAAFTAARLALLDPDPTLRATAAQLLERLKPGKPS